MQKKMLLGAAVVGLSLAFAGGSVQAQDAAKPQVVQVKLSEWTMGMADTTVKGPAEFDVENAGKYPHVFTIQGKVGGKDVMVSSALLKPGEKTTLTISLPAGTYNVYCPLPGHAEQGMKSTLTVQ